MYCKKRRKDETVDVLIGNLFVLAVKKFTFSASIHAIRLLVFYETLIILEILWICKRCVMSCYRSLTLQVIVLVSIDCHSIILYAFLIDLLSLLM